MAAAELTGVAVVAAGSFNPAIIHPRWLADKKLIPENAAEHALQATAPQQMIVTSPIAAFVADWLSIQVVQEQAVFSTVDLSREMDLRDFAIGIFDLLPETPLNAVGINSDTHIAADSVEAWHKFGDRFLPKDLWEPFFEKGTWRKRNDGKRVGMRVMTVEVHRDDERLPGWVRVELAPSVRVVPNGIYIGINSHFQLSVADRRGSGYDAVRVLREQWDKTRALENELISHLLEEV